MNWGKAAAPSLDDLAELAEAARNALPEPFTGPAREVLIRVVDLADDDMLDSVGARDPFELSGLYEGVPLTERSVLDQPEQPDVIWLFRRAILDEWAERQVVTLGELVTHILVHEMAHHFGWSDDDIARIDRWWE